MRTTATLGFRSPRRRRPRTGDRRDYGRGSDGNCERGASSRRSALGRAVWREPILSGASGYRRHRCWDLALSLDHEDGGGEKVTPGNVSMCADFPPHSAPLPWRTPSASLGTPPRKRYTAGRAGGIPFVRETGTMSMKREGATSNEGERAASENGLGSVGDRVLPGTPFSRSVPNWPAGSIPSRPSLRASPRRRAATHPIPQDQAGPEGR